MLDHTKKINCMRDPTRGGVAATLNEIAKSAAKGIKLVESDIPLDESVKAASDILGLDPLYIANEGKVLVIVDPKSAEDVLAVMKRFDEGKKASIIGTVVTDHPSRVIMETAIGTKRIVDMPSGEQLPRIC